MFKSNFIVMAMNNELFGNGREEMHELPSKMTCA
jgi:hypothetical protein